MQRSSLDELCAGDDARYVAGKTFAHFRADPALWGVVLWDRPDRQDLLELRRSLVLELEPSASAHVSVVDASRVTGVDMAAFDELRTYVEQHAEALSRAVTRLALVRPDGLPGAVVAGIFEVMPQPYPVRVFAALNDAMAWLVEEDPSLAPQASRLPSTLDELVLGCLETAPVVQALATYFAANLTQANINDAARALRVSLRTLQRRLSAADTTFQEQLGLARLAAAQRLMLDSDQPLTAIALEVGCASLQHFSALFRRHTGLSPSVWRRSQEKG
jgi:AraC-like DNA-binding protein